MKNRRIGLIALLMCAVLCMGVMLISCTESTDSNDTTANNDTDNVADTSDKKDSDKVTQDDGKVTYTIKVTDEGGNPIANAAVQICKDACIPGVTDDKGEATFRVAEDSYKASMLALPEGYTYQTEKTEFYFDAGSYKLTIVLKAIG